jgi:hypothetical protein
MKIAVIGSGISGLGAAWLLSRTHDVTVFEANTYVGGHTHTHEVELGTRTYRVDSGFIVCNPDHYPHFFRMLGELGVDTQPTTMSFALRNERSGLEYNATDLNRLFVQRRNLVSPRFWSMVRGILRFYREAPALLELADAGPDLGDYLEANGYSAAFRDDHLLPMASALWSSPSAQILKFPAKYLVAFMANHQMMVTGDRKPWRVVRDGSNSYVKRHARQRVVHPAHERRRCAAVRARRPTVPTCNSTAAMRTLRPGGVSPATATRRWPCSPTRAPRRARDPRRDHVPGQRHRPAHRRPPAPQAPHAPGPPGMHWCCDDARNAACTVTYDMNQLQGLECARELLRHPQLQRPHRSRPGRS